MQVLVGRVLKHFSEQAESARQFCREVSGEPASQTKLWCCSAPLFIALSQSTAQGRTASLIRPWLPLALGQQSWITAAPELILTVMLGSQTHISFRMCWIFATVHMAPPQPYQMSSGTNSWKKWVLFTTLNYTKVDVVFYSVELSILGSIWSSLNYTTTWRSKSCMF